MEDINYWALGVAIAIIIYILYALWRGQIWTLEERLGFIKQYRWAYKNFFPVDYWGGILMYTFVAVLLLLLAFNIIYPK